MFEHPEYMPGWMSPIRDGDNEKLVKACAAGRLGDARKELALGASPNATAWLLGAPISALSAAIRSGSTAVVGLLLDSGARAGGAAEERQKPLATALLNLENEEAARMTRILLDAGAPFDDESDDGFTPLHIAAMLCNADAAEMLIRAGSDPDAEGGPGGVRASELADPETLLRIKDARMGYMVMTEHGILADEACRPAPAPTRKRL